MAWEKCAACSAVKFTNQFLDKHIQPGSFTIKPTASNPLGEDTTVKAFFITVTQGGVKLYLPVVRR
jgi:hypothetical protein